ncbi:riken cdna 2810410a08 [Stylonychia lemnae]|uniref:Methyltransferase-like protein 5 n=1 Tax=Stylonychia lemnae TaxID=5949 RepID=A0A078A1V6_STYLE|nr:riken cdna 2810410a08 [Stylonychia lemnae]|eukprot:CDW75448.1 riken cdna 2810410a08 [Stylonychia lemnae]
MKKISAFKLKNFVSYLSCVEEFENPNVKLEQYMTPPDITANMFSIFHFEEDAIESKTIADFCCGTGMYSIASTYFKPDKVFGFDIDTEALQTCTENIENAELVDQIELVQCNICEIQDNPRFKDYFDTVIMNPPFGTKNNEGIDMKLLSTAIYVRIFS